MGAAKVSASRSSSSHAPRNETDIVLALAQGLHDPVDAVPWESEDNRDSPVVKGIDEDVSCRVAHRRLPVNQRGGTGRVLIVADAARRLGGPRL